MADINHTKNSELTLGRLRRRSLERFASHLQQDTAPPVDGWITYASWKNQTKSPIRSFTTTWIVPPPPTLNDAQYVYLFNGIQSCGLDSGILQPVLQWRPDTSEKGLWSVATWYYTRRGPAIHTPFVPVSTGDSLIGEIVLDYKDENGFNYRACFQGIDETVLWVESVPELLECVQTLEAYRIKNCSNYPKAERTEFREINIVTGDGTPSVNWLKCDRVATCGHTTEIVNNSGENGQIDILYGPPTSER